MSKISIRFYNDREVRTIWDESATHKKYLLVRQEGDFDKAVKRLRNKKD